MPVGQDQVQHLEMTRDMAGKFNRAYGDFSRCPSRSSKGPRFPGTDGQKMSKSYSNTIEIFAEGKPLKKAGDGGQSPIRRRWKPRRTRTRAPSSLCTACSPREDERSALASRYRAGGLGYGEAKGMLLAKIDDLFGPAREKRKQLAADPAIVDDVLRQGAAKARAEAQATMKLVRAAAGFGVNPFSDASQKRFSMHDVIIIGGGHNGLTAAAYLARAGRKVLVLERRPVLGGACVTEEIFPGCKVSTAAYVNSLSGPKSFANWS